MRIDSSQKLRQYLKANKRTLCLTKWQIRNDLAIHSSSKAPQSTLAAPWSASRGCCNPAPNGRGNTSEAKLSPSYHSVVAVRYPDLCRVMDNLWELGSFASGGIPDRPPKFVLWDTAAKINGLVAADLNTRVSHVIEDFEGSRSYCETPRKHIQ